MNLIKLTVRNLLRERKEYSLFVLIEALCVAVIVNSINISTIGMIEKTLGVTTTESQLLQIVVFSFVVSCYVESYFLTKKAKQIAVIRLSGGSVIHTSIFLGIQNLIIEALGAVLGLVLGVIVSPLYAGTIKSNINSNFVDAINISSEAIIVTLVIIGIKFLLSLLLVVGFSYRKSITELLSLEKTVFEEDKRTTRISNKVYWTFYIIGLVLLYMAAGSDALLIILALLAFIGANSWALVKFWLPEMMNKIRKRGNIYKRDKMICIENTIYTMTRTAILTVAMSFGIIAIGGGALAPVRISEEERFMNIIQLIAFMILISFSVLFKLLNEMEKRKTIYKRLNVIGYSKKEIMNLISKEVLYYFSSITVYTFIPLVAVVIAVLVRTTTPLSSVLTLVLLPLLSILVIAVITNVCYKKIVRKVL